MCNDLSPEEIAKGEAAAQSLVEHMIRMRASRAEMPVIDEHGQPWIVSVRRQALTSSLVSFGKN